MGYRSSAYAAKLQQQGFEAKNLEGGCMRWVSEISSYASCSRAGVLQEDWAGQLLWQPSERWGKWLT